MAYSAITQVDTYSNAYSFMPLRLSDTSVGDVNKYKYIVNILYNEATVNTITTANYEGNVFAQVEFTANHPFNRGDILFVTDSTDTYTDYYTVMAIINSTTIIIDLEIGVPVTGTLTASNVLKYKVSPNPDNELKLDLSNTIKDFVSQDLEDSNDIYAAPSTLLDYNLKCGHEGTALFQFDDNLFNGGNVGFVDASLTSTTQVDFSIGDSIIIQQDLYTWDYDDNYFTAGNVGFTGSTSHIFESGDTVTITGQITNPSYNGSTTIISTDTNSIVVDKSFGSSSPAEPGTIYGVPVPEYNTTATITDIYYSAGTGVVILTNIGFATSTPPIGGTIKHSDGRIVRDYDELNITGLTAYNSYVNQYDYSIDDFDKYVCQVRGSGQNNISTILSGTTNRFRIEPSTKSWLLAHTKELGAFEANARYFFYDYTDTLISWSRLNNTEAYEDFYFPIGIEQLVASSNLDTISGSDLSAVTADVSYYDVFVERQNAPFSNPIRFEINDDCSRYEIYHIMWKDARGSWISYPFKYVSQDTVDVNRQNYYQTEGTWTDNSFGFDSFGRGERTFFARSRKKVRVTSGWVEEFENDLLVDMMKSADVYVQLPDGKLIGCTIEEEEIQLGKDINEQIFNYTFNVVYSMDEIRL